MAAHGLSERNLPKPPFPDAIETCPVGVRTGEEVRSTVPTVDDINPS